MTLCSIMTLTITICVRFRDYPEGTAVDEFFSFFAGGRGVEELDLIFMKITSGVFSSSWRAGLNLLTSMGLLP